MGTRYRFGIEEEYFLADASTRDTPDRTQPFSAPLLLSVTLDRHDLSRRLVLVRHTQKPPNVLSVEEVGRLLEAAPGPKYKAALGTA